MNGPGESGFDRYGADTVTGSEMNILQVAHGYPPYSLAGVEVYTRWFARALAKRHEVRVFSTRQLSEGEDLSLIEEELDGIPVTFLVNKFVDYDPIRDARHDAVAGRFDAFLERVRPDLVHFQHLIKLSTTLLDACRSRGIPTVLTLHDYWFLCPLINLCSATSNSARRPATWRDARAARWPPVI